MESTSYTFTGTIREDADTALMRAIPRDGGAEVMLKLPRRGATSKRRLARLEHEFSILRDLDLVGVVKARGIERVDDQPALILEPLKGVVLSEAIGDKALELRDVLKIGISLGRTLGELHRRGIVHTGIRPQSLFWDGDRAAITILDLDSATRLSQESPRLLSPEVVEGGLAYMSPEQTGRMNRTVDYRADFYSLGVILYQASTAELPFSAVDPIELIHCHVARSPTPPVERIPTIPRAVSNIVMKLLAKAAEDRYQSARGLCADLEECLSRLDAGDESFAFPLGRSDRAEELRIPQKLYGREREISSLFSAFERVCGGTAELLLVTGQAGIGKSSLVREAHKPIARAGGFFVAGKFDQIHCSAPYGAFAEAFRELGRQILSSRPEVLIKWKERVASALGQNGKLVTDLVPEIEILLGPQPALREMTPAEAQGRFLATFASFVRSVATEEHPLVVFLDDFQWADPSSLRLVEHLMTDETSAHLLVVGAYRDSEVQADHPLSQTFSNLSRAGAATDHISLEPLSSSDIGVLLGEAIGADPSSLEALARVVGDKTEGNPLFIHQFVMSLVRDELLSFDAGKGHFVWDMPRIEARAATDNVIEILLAKMAELGRGTQEILSLAAAVGHRFELSTLARVSEELEPAVAAKLWGALVEGLVVPLDEAYRFYGEAPERSAPGPLGEEIDVAYRFLHDRVQMAAYSRIADEDRSSVHLRIGRVLRARLSEETEEGELFNVAYHLALGAPRLTDPDERESAARLCFEAGQRAKERLAYEAARSHLEGSATLLGEEGWARDEKLAFEVNLARAECEFLCQRIEQAEALCEMLLLRARSKVDKARVYVIALQNHISRLRTEAVLDDGCLALGLLGEEIPSSNDALEAAFVATEQAIEKLLGGRDLSELMDAKPSSDTERKLHLRIAEIVFSVAFNARPMLAALLAARAVETSLESGHSNLSSMSYMMYAVSLSTSFGRHEEAYRFGRFALELNERFDNIILACRLRVWFGSHVCPFCTSIDVALALLEEAIRLGIEAGDLAYATYARTGIMSLGIMAGRSLAQISTDSELAMALALRARDQGSELSINIVRQFLKGLAGRSSSATSLSDDGFDEEATSSAIVESRFAWGISVYFALKVALCFIHGDRERARLVLSALPESAPRSMNNTYIAILVFFEALSLGAHELVEDPGERARILLSIEPNHARLRRWVESCASTFRHQERLVAAERARLEGDELAAMKLYDEAIEGARKGESLRDEAIGNELAARFHRAAGRDKIANFYRMSAIRAYERWGAIAKVRALRVMEDSELFAAELEPLTPRSRGFAAEKRARGYDLDVATVLRAAQAMAGEIRLDAVLEKIMRVVVESAGAQRAVLILEREGKPWVEAAITIEPAEVEVRIGVPLEAYVEVPATLVHYVARAKEPVIVGDARRSPRFADDPYLAARAPRSILCLDLKHRGALVGVLYLENNAVSDAFVGERAELLRLLSSHVAVAVQNAQLFEHVESISEDLRRSNRELSEANERLEVELTERVRAEEERAELQDKIILGQKARLAELSTPLIPITDRIMVMPLIGTMDEERTSQVLEAALNGAQIHRTEVLIMDITGVKDMHTGVASALLKTARALKLLGTEVALTGIRPEAAQTLVNLGADLGSLLTLGTLQSAIAWALGRRR